MIREHKFEVDDAVVEFFAARTKREREDLLRVFAGLATSPHQKGEWHQRTSSGRELQVKRFGRWLVRYWLDEPVLEVRIVDVEKVVPRVALISKVLNRLRIDGALQIGSEILPANLSGYPLRGWAGLVEARGKGLAVAAGQKMRHRAFCCPWRLSRGGLGGVAWQEA
jgi:hypothetical protein